MAETSRDGKLLLSLEEVRRLALLERQMDEGTLAYVVYQGERCAMMPDVLEHLGLKSGQQVSSTIFHEIIKTNLAFLQRQIDEQEAKVEGDK